MFSWVLVSSLVVGTPALKDIRKPSNPPVGLWFTERFETDGIELAKANVRIRNDSISYPGFKGTETEPIEFYTLNGDGRVNIGPPTCLMKGIWRIDADRLIMCTAETGVARPDTFEAPKGSWRTLWVLKRIGD